MEKRWIFSTMILTLLTAITLWGSQNPPVGNDRKPADAMQIKNPSAALTEKISQSPSLIGSDKVAQQQERSETVVSKLEPAHGPEPEIESDKKQDYYQGKPTVAERARQYGEGSLDALKQNIADLEATLKEQQWIERANRNELSADEREHLADLLQQEAALRLALVEKKLAALEGELL